MRLFKRNAIMNAILTGSLTNPSGQAPVAGTSYETRVFVTNGTITFTEPVVVDMLIVAGGGSGGGGYYAGGGGGGGMLEQTSRVIPAGTYNIVVGVGGVSVSGNGVSGNNGGDSSFNGCVALGGGAGHGYVNGSYGHGVAGGSGGGAGCNIGATGGAATQGNSNGATGYGFRGGNSSNSAGGGGGGAGSAGGDAFELPLQTNGGLGRINSITGTAVSYSKGGKGAAVSGTPRVPVNNTGYGGDAAASDGGTSAAGSSGIVVIKYAVAYVTPPVAGMDYDTLSTIVSGTAVYSGMTVTSGAAGYVFGSVSSNNFYFEATGLSNYSGVGVGLSNASSMMVDYAGNVYSVQTKVGDVGGAIAVSDVVGIAIKNDVFYIYINNVLKFSIAYAGAKKALVYINGSGLNVTANFGATQMKYEAPAGITAGIPFTPVVIFGAEYSSTTGAAANLFDASSSNSWFAHTGVTGTTWAGMQYGSNKTYTGFSFKPAGSWAVKSYAVEYSTDGGNVWNIFHTATGLMAYSDTTITVDNKPAVSANRWRLRIITSTNLLNQEIESLSFIYTKPLVIGQSYFGGNYAPYSATTDKVLHSNESVSLAAAVLSVARSHLSGISSALKGYFCAGYNGASLSLIDGVVFDSGTSFTLGNALIVGGDSRSSNVQSAIAGYIGGGALIGSSSTNKIEKLTFASEVAAYLSAMLSLSRYCVVGVNSSTNGYFAGGISTTVIDKLNFTTDTSTAISDTLTSISNQGSGSFSSVKGYVIKSANNYKTLDSINFATDTVAAVTASLTPTEGSARWMAGASQSATKGYWAGGQALNTISGLDFSNETTADLAGTMSITRYCTAGVGCISS